MEFINFDLQAILDAIVAFLPRLGLGVLVYLLARWIANWVTRILRRRLTAQDHDEELIILLEMLTRWGIQGIGIVLAFEQLAPGRLSTLLAGLGIAGITIGFALQDVAKNFVAGILLLLTQPFEIGDMIEVKGYSGEVLAINLRSTELREADGRYVIIPNTDVFISPLVNYTRAHRRRIQLPLKLAVATDINLATEVAISEIGELPGFLEDPAPQFVIDSFTGSFYQCALYYWIDTGTIEFIEAQSAGAQLIQRAFKTADILLQ